jgi:hypothetical protein
LQGNEKTGGLSQAPLSREPGLVLNADFVKNNVIISLCLLFDVNGK